MDSEFCHWLMFLLKIEVDNFAFEKEVIIMLPNNVPELIKNLLYSVQELWCNL